MGLTAQRTGHKTHSSWQADWIVAPRLARPDSSSPPRRPRGPHSHAYIFTRPRRYRDAHASKLSEEDVVFEYEVYQGSRRAQLGSLAHAHMRMRMRTTRGSGPR